MISAWQTVTHSARLLAEILLITVLCEILVMLLLPMLAPGLSGWSQALLDATMLSMLVAPVLVWRVMAQGRRRMAARGEPDAPSALRDSRAVPGLVFLAGSGLTIALVLSLHRELDQSASKRFDAMVARLDASIQDRLARALDALIDIRSASVLLGRPLSAAELRTWVGQRQLHVEYPGVRAMSLIERVERSDVAAFVHRMRAEGQSDFTLRGAGPGPDLMLIRAIEPWLSNKPALGFDIGSDAIRREAAQAAIDTGQAALSRHVLLVQDGGQRMGLLYFLPLKLPGVRYSAIAANHAGLACVPLVVDELLHGLADTLHGQATFQLFEETPNGAPAFLLNPPMNDRQGRSQAAQRAGYFQSERVIHVGGRDMVLRVRSTPLFDGDIGQGMPAWLGVLGIMLSAMAAVAAWLMRTTQGRAAQLAKSMTRDLVNANKMAEQASRESAALVHTLDQFSMVCITAPNGQIREVNEAFCQACGYTRAELLGRNTRLLNAGVQDPYLWVAVWQTLLRGQPWSGQVCNRGKDGRLYWTQCVIAPITGADGQVDKYISIAYDITEARRIQDELKASAERYNLAIDGGNDGLWDRMDVHADEEWWSPQYYRLLGYEPNEIPASLSTFKSLLHPEDRQRTSAAHELAFERHESFDVECRLKTKVGAYRWFRSRGKVYFDEAGAPTRMAGALQDVHYRKEAQAKLKEHSQQVAAIFSLSPDGFVSFDAQGCISYISPAFAALTGLPGALLVGLDEQQFSERLFERAMPHPTLGSLSAVKQMMQQAEASHTDARRAVIEMKPPGRRMLELRLLCSEGGAVSQVLHLRDVTYETEVDHMKSAFLSMAAHELRTPMSSIYGFTELLLTRELHPDKQKDLLGRIYRQSEAMAQIINELLDLARIEARQGKDFEFAAVNVGEVLSDIIRDFKVPQDRLPPFVAWPDTPVIVWVDRQKLQQAVLNVLSNAYKYSPQGGDVELRFVTRQEQARAQVGIEIEDHGLGLSAEQLARVGERFYRADKSGSIPGTGLGITIVKEIMDVLGGALSLSSELGRGTTVTLWLPRVEPSPVLKSAQTRDKHLLQVVTKFPAQ